MRYIFKTSRWDIRRIVGSTGVMTDEEEETAKAEVKDQRFVCKGPEGEFWRKEERVSKTRKVEISKGTLW